LFVRHSEYDCASSDKYWPVLKFCSSLLRIQECLVAQEMVYEMSDRATMKVGFLSLPLTGHLNPMAALARKLQSQVASTEALSRMVMCGFISIYSFFCRLAVRLTVTVLFITCDRLSVLF